VHGTGSMWLHTGSFENDTNNAWSSRGPQSSRIYLTFSYSPMDILRAFALHFALVDHGPLD
jgi:hypothetical protein